RNRGEVVAGVLAPPDLQNYVQQASQVNFKPKMYVIDKATGYPEPMVALGTAGYDILSVNVWSPACPGESKYGDYDGKGLAGSFEDANKGKQYIPPLGYDDASYDVLFDAIQRAGTTDKEAVRKALAETDLVT